MGFLISLFLVQFQAYSKRNQSSVGFICTIKINSFKTAQAYNQILCFASCWCLPQSSNSIRNHKQWELCEYCAGFVPFIELGLLPHLNLFP
ncbi:hypothetical protein V6Z11_D08G203800 [Gossypium hirsutum]